MQPIKIIGFVLISPLMVLILTIAILNIAYITEEKNTTLTKEEWLEDDGNIKTAIFIATILYLATIGIAILT